MSDKPQQPIEKTSTPSQLYIVGIGASAGGVQALKEFFENTPPDTGIAYVVILHLSPDHDSHLTSLLQTVTKMQVQQVLEKVKVQPNNVYVVPPNQHLMMEDGHLTVSVNTAVEERRAPVDIFFRTLAESHKTRAIAVILSGTGANGSMGMKRVKEKGGAVFVQNPREAEFSEMPRNSIATELVDEVLPVADIPGKIVSYIQSQGSVFIPLDVTEQPQDQQQALREIFTQLRLRTGHDFTNYKRPTLLRRIERRINIHNLADLPAYTAYLQQHPDEITSLLKDLLISVTNFFRDKKAFEELESTVLPLIFHGKNSADQVRIWVAGCATGEEAYSLAMLCAERTMNVLDSPKVQIFATDIDDAAITASREGLYTLNDAADVSPERLRRFFTKEGDDYRIRREIREMVLFASHNFLKDPPFSHLNLISCRNVLIYLNHTAQERVMETFHFALNPGGYLFLGTSESTDTATDLYSNYNREHHIFQSRQATNRTYPLPESVPSFRQYQPPATTSAIPETSGRSLDRITYGDLHQRLLEQYAPPSMVVNEEYDIIHLSERAGRYLQIAGGELSRNLLKLIRPELRLELRSALYQAAQRQAPVEVQGLQLGMDDGTERLNIQVRPALQDDTVAKGFILIIFTPAESDTPENIIYSSDEPAARHLEEELIRLKAQLRTSNEQHEFQAEELKAANEELQAMNEELRSAAEELETSKEELQSINEELTTVNQELKVKVDEVSMAGNNLQNLINSTDLGTIFLDRSFRVVLFTPSTRNIFNLIPADIGRSLSDITSKLDYEDLIADAELVLEKLQAVERELKSLDDRTYLMRILPYRTVEDRIQGVVITFIDITERKQAEEVIRQAEEKYRIQLEKDVANRTAELKESREQYRSLIENTPDLIMRWDKDLRLEFANSALEVRTGNSNAATIGKTKAEMGQPAEIALPYMEKLRQVFATGEELEYFNILLTPQGELPLLSRMVPEKNEEGEVVTVLSIGRDISELQQAQQEVIAVKEELAQRATDKYQTLFNSIDEGFCIIEVLFDKDGRANDYRFLEANPAFERQTGLANAIGKNVKTLVPDIEAYWPEIYGKVALSGEPVRFENESKAMESYYDVYALRYGRPEDHQVAVLFSDITHRKKQEQQKLTLADVSEKLVGLSHVGETLKQIGKIIGQYFGVKWCIFSELQNNNEVSVLAYGWNDEAVPSHQGIYRLDDYLSGEQLAKNNAGQPSVCNDTQMDTGVSAEKYAALGVRSFVAVPLARDGRWQFMLAIMDDAPRRWRKEEVEFLKEVAGRIWERLERARAEEVLQESEERLQTLIRNLPGAAVFIVDKNLRYQLAEGEALAQAGLHSADLIGKTIYESLPKEGIKQHEEQYYKALAGEPFSIEHYEYNHTYMSRGTPLRNTAGEVYAVLAISFDITDRKNAEEALRISEERYRIVLQSADMGAWDWNIIEDTVIWNLEHYTMLGADPQHQPMNADYFLHFIHSDDKEKVVNALYEAVATGGIYQSEFRIVRDDTGETCWMYGYGRVAAMQNGQATRMVGVMSDITKRKKLEQQREDFLGFASHELKTPVTSIKAYAQILLGIFEASDDTHSAALMQKLDKQVNRLTSLISDLLDVTKISEGELPLHLEAFDFNDLLQERAEDLQRLSTTHKLVMDLCDNAVFTADKERIGQVITNFVSNAIKYSPMGKEIILRCQRNENELQISVQDFGIGIPEDVQRKVFDRFFRVKETQIQNFPGLGLGLFISAGIIHRHGGKIWVESKPGEGSTFYFTLPVK